jgi:hypothetical protein
VVEMNGLLVLTSLYCIIFRKLLSQIQIDAVYSAAVELGSHVDATLSRFQSLQVQLLHKTTKFLSCLFNSV